MATRRVLNAIANLVAVATLAAGGADDSPDSAGAATTTTARPEATTTTTTAPIEPLRILLVNDDGIINPAIDVMLELIAAEEDVEVTVVAPADERSGSSDSTTEGGARSEEHTSEPQSLMRISYAVFCLKKK